MVSSRRGFLRAAGQAAGLLSLAAVAPAVARSAPAPRVAPALQVGYQIFGWSRAFPAAWWAGAAAVGALGFKGIEGEYTIAELYEGREAEFEDGMQRRGVRLAALYVTADLERAAERYENHRKHLAAAAFARRMGARMLVLGGTHATRKDPELFRTYAREATAIGRTLLDTHGVRLGVHPHMGALVETREEIARVMDDTDPRYFFLAPDTGHLLAAGSDPVEIVTTYRERIVHAHLKDYRRPEPGAARGRFVPLGDGDVDFRALVAAIASRPFDGWLNVELDGGRGQDPADVASEARRYITGTLGLSLG